MPPCQIARLQLGPALYSGAPRELGDRSSNMFSPSRMQTHARRHVCVCAPRGTSIGRGKTGCGRDVRIACGALLLRWALLPGCPECSEISSYKHWRKIPSSSPCARANAEYRVPRDASRHITPNDSLKTIARMCISHTSKCAAQPGRH